MIFLDSITSQVIWFKFISSETKFEYQQGLELLLKQGFEILSVTIDGRVGIPSVFSSFPVQICQFHQIQIVNRYLTKNPKLLASKQLKTIIEDLTIVNQKGFESRFNYYLDTNQEFINEKTINPETGRPIYKHKKLRSAVNSIKNNLKYLFTCRNHPILNIPNTTNHIDGGVNPKLRELVRTHRGLRKDRRNKILTVLLNSLGRNKP